MYKGVGGWEGGGVGVGGGWEAGGGLHRPTGLFGVAMSPRSASHRPRHDGVQEVLVIGPDTTRGP